MHHKESSGSLRDQTHRCSVPLYLKELQSYCAEEATIANLLIKALPKGKFETLWLKMSLEELNFQPPD